MIDKDRLFSLAPVSFFQISWDCPYLDHSANPFLSLKPAKLEKYWIPDTSSLCNEISFAKLAMGWNKEGIELFAKVQEPFQQACYPEISKGDCLEIMLDTRDVKTSGYNTRFCHHFFFLPEGIEGHQAGEMTRFRTEDRHDLGDPKDLKIQSKITTKGYTLQIFIPKEALFGYDPEQFNRIGFTYRLNRLGASPQHFSCVSDDFQIEQQPSLWSSVKLLK